MAAEALAQSRALAGIEHDFCIEPRRCLALEPVSRNHCKQPLINSRH
jgi:hypothetical protein